MTHHYRLHGIGIRRRTVCGRLRLRNLPPNANAFSLWAIQSSNMLNKKIAITNLLFLLLLGQLLCVGQKVDSTALRILESSFDKVNNINSVNYRMIFVDSTGSDRGILLNKIDTVFVNQFTKGERLFTFSTGVAKWVTKDTLFTYDSRPSPRVVAVNNGDSHEVSTYDITNLLGTNRNFADNRVDSINFSPTLNNQLNDCYCIDIHLKKRVYNNGTVTSQGSYDRLWIDKNTLLPIKDRHFSKLVDNLWKVDINIYEFSLLLPFSSPQSISTAIFKDYNLRREPTSTVGNFSTNDFLGHIAPDFAATNYFTNKKEKLSAYKGKVVLLDFWFLACGPCRTLMPVLNKIYYKYKNKDLLVVGVNTKDKNSEAVKKFLKTQGYLYTQIGNAYNIEEKYALESFPTTLLIDKSGKNIHAGYGYSDDFEGRITKLIDKELEK